MQKTSRDSYRYQKRQYPNLQLRRRRWYAVLEIPRDLQQQLRRQKYVASLQTDSLAKAKERLPAMLAKWRSQIAEARQTTPEDEDAAFYRNALASAKTDQEREQIRFEIQDRADDIAAINMDWDKHQHFSDVPEAAEFHSRATGSKVAFAAHLGEWLVQSNVTDKTKDMQRSDVQRFAKAFPWAQDVTHAKVQQWAIGLGVEPKTVRRVLSALRGHSHINRNWPVFTPTSWLALSPILTGDHSFATPWPPSSLVHAATLRRSASRWSSYSSSMGI